MIPVKLHLSGFLSYQEPVNLDFTTFDLACISGSNGAGKSSLLDAMTWALFGQARRRDDTVINSHATTAEVSLEFRYEENLYRVTRAKTREKPTVLEFAICTEEGAWKPLTEKSMRTTEERIASTLRLDYETFINASFFLQGKADQFAQQRPSDRKRVLSTILGLEVWETYRTNAADKRKGVEMELRSVDDQVADIDSELAQETQRKTRLAEAEARLDQVSQVRKAQATTLDSLHKQAAILENQRRMVDLLYKTSQEQRLRFEKIRAGLDRLSKERAGYEQVLAGEAEVIAAHQRWLELRKDLERWDSVAANFREIEAHREKPRTTIATEESRLQQEKRGLDQQEVTVTNEQARLAGLETQLATLGDSLAKLEAQVGGKTGLETQLHAIQGAAAEALVENRRLKDEMNALKERIDQLKSLEGANCPLCGQPLSADERGALIANLEIDGKKMGDRFRNNLELKTQSETQVREIQAQITGLARVDSELREQHRQYDRLETECKRIRETAEKWAAGGAVRLAELSRVLSEGDFAHTARAALAEIDEKSRALGYDPAAHDAVRQAEQQGRGSEDRLNELKAARAALAPLERQVGDLEKQSAEEAAKLAGQEEEYTHARASYEAEAAQLPDIGEAERTLYSAQSEENRLRMEVGMLHQSVAVLETQRTRRVKLIAQRENLSLQIARLKTLERAFSKDGVPALLIEQALPEIETQANDLLDRLSSGTMSVRFETQRQFKDKNRDDKRETLDIIISDAAGPREYELFSGGEAFRVNFAIRLALSRVLAQRAGARLQTLVIDEGFGSQDAEGRQRLIEAINMVRPEFKKILVITHMEELKEAFPARIEVEKTPRGSQVSVMV
jgi:DNA repair protein SbcC/Rad50